MIDMLLSSFKQILPVIKVCKRVICLLLFSLLCSQYSFSQIAQTRAQIIDDHGTDFTSGTTDGDEWVRYEIKTTTKESGTYNKIAIYYFTPLPNVGQVCYTYQYLHPSTEANSWIKLFKKNYIEINETEWRSKNVCYTVKVIDDYFIIDVKLKEY